MSFAHLHVHTQYSFLDGALRIKDLVSAAKDAGMSSVAMTDRGNLYGAIEFQKAAQKAGIKPIFGCEVFVVPDRTDPAEKRYTNLVLLAENDVGYKNLIAAVSHGWLEGWHNDIPRVDAELLSQYSEGVIALSGGLGGAISQSLLRRESDKAAEIASQWLKIYGPDHFYLQIEELGFKENRQVNEALVGLGQELGIKAVATNYCHYLTKSDARAHAALTCIGLGRAYTALQGDPPSELWFKPESEIRDAFDWAPECVDLAHEIAERCNTTIELGKIYLPQYGVPEGEDLASFLRSTSHKGLNVRLAEMDARNEPYDRKEYEDRLDVELEIIIQMDFPGYFLIVWDFIRAAREMNVPVGPGRGSGAGSLVAYSLRITDINPIPYGLLFERFLNPERVSMPDFDIDFCMNKRDQVIRYVTEKYGQHNVGQIITYGTLKAKAALRDVGRVLALTFGEVDRIAKLIPDELGITLSQALEKEPRLNELFDEDERYRELYDMALRLEGLTRHAGMHAAGIVIGEEVLWDYVPICRGANGEIVTQFAKDEVEEAGLVKFDFLGLKTLTVLDHAVRLINEGRAKTKEPIFDLNTIDIADKAVYELISSGNTTGVFQLESSGFKELLKKLKPDCFEDIVAAVALYRPGPLGTGMVDDFVKRKHGELEVEYPHPALESVLGDTYGVIVYQEQVMSIARIIAGYTLGGADLLRRAMGKKKVEVMAQQRDIFLEGSEKVGICEPKLAGDIFDLMAYFAGYGFNKSHSAAYALISYQTAFLKTHFPVEFMAALLTADGDNTDKVVRYIADARDQGIVVRPPDVNLSEKDFSVDNGGIRFGLGAIKNVGEGAVDTILLGREDGDYKSLFDMLEQVDTKRVNRRVLEALVKSGAFDEFGQERHVLFHNIPRALERGAARARDRASGQMGMFDLFGGEKDEGSNDSSYNMDCEPWLDRQRLALEKEAIGFYVSGHPLDRFTSDLARYATHNTATVINAGPRDEITLGGVVVAMRERPLRSGKGRMAFVTIEDLQGQVEAIFFSKAYGPCEEILKSGEPMLLYGHPRLEGEDENKTLRLRATKALLLSELRRERTSKVAFKLDSSLIDATIVKQLNTLCAKHPGNCDVVVLVDVPGAGRAVLQTRSALRVDPGEELVAAAERLLGPDTVLLA
jgi:DNA polymerase-3 subunit alpha